MVAPPSSRTAAKNEVASVTDRERKLEIVAKKLVKYFGDVDPSEYALAVAEDPSTLDVCVTLAKAALVDE